MICVACHIVTVGLGPGFYLIDTRPGGQGCKDLPGSMAPAQAKRGGLAVVEQLLDSKGSPSASAKAEFLANLVNVS
ncbi:hypothetical protein PoB_003563000 [Plakobranchus ocellatus]|uniref:Cytochrome c domain-containing protein n=1 Tax=Plakobranchus ocellatus TaxID=259542 RepID=A0AAV4AP40_9GAST|nr:hypothetical protein PoB_003563000 [Plakobranchus ocellatus]